MEIIGVFPFMLSLVEAFMGFSAELFSSDPQRLHTMDVNFILNKFRNAD